MPGWLEDTKETWNKLPTWGKWGVGLTVLAVVGIALYELYSSQQASAAGATTQASGDTTGASGDTSGGGGGGAYPTTTSGNSTVPVLPAGVNPVYDSQGNLIAFSSGSSGAVVPPNQNAPQPSTTIPSDTTPGPVTPTITPPSPGPVTSPPPISTVNPVFTPQPVGGFANQAQAQLGCISNCLATVAECKGKLKGSASCKSWCNAKCVARHPT